MLRLQTQIPRAFLQLRLAFMRTPTPRKQNEQHLLLGNEYPPAHAVLRLGSLLACSVVIGTNITEAKKKTSGISRFFTDQGGARRRKPTRLLWGTPSLCNTASCFLPRLCCCHRHQHHRYKKTKRAASPASKRIRVEPAVGNLRGSSGGTLQLMQY